MPPLSTIFCSKRNVGEKGNSATSAQNPHSATADSGFTEVRSDYKAGKLTERDARTLLSDNQSPQLVRDFRRLPLEKALEVWDVADDQERKQLRPILKKKAQQLKNRVPAERAPLQQKLKAALSEKTAPQPAIPNVLRKLLTSTAATVHP
jgi:uncharacterized protein YPO0396